MRGLALHRPHTAAHPSKRASWVDRDATGGFPRLLKTVWSFLAFGMLLLTAATLVPHGIVFARAAPARALRRCGGKLPRAAARLSGGAAAPAAAATTRVVDDIVSAALDRRLYRWVELDSGLRALLISDANSDKAAAALEVKTGHFDDPADVAGLAHFTEHMMFLGTESFPDERSFKDFIGRHGGSSNAFTGMESTGYHFGVNANALPEALGRFASFFVEPLLREDSARREMQAVHSEFQRNLQSDQRRIFQLIKSTCDPVSGVGRTKPRRVAARCPTAPAALPLRPSSNFSGSNVDTPRASLKIARSQSVPPPQSCHHLSRCHHLP